MLLLKVVAQLLLENLLEQALIRSKVPKLPSRVPPIMKGLSTLEQKDYLFLVLNQFIETAFVMELIHMCQTDTRLSAVPYDVTTVVVSVVIPFYLIFLVDDLAYYVFHRVMHVPGIYAYVHKHHHRQALPKRGYLDAANEHPLEQVGGLACVWIAIWTTMTLYAAISLQVHVSTLVIFLACYGALAFLNHTEFDFQMGWLGFGYTVRAHETHHR